MSEQHKPPFPRYPMSYAPPYPNLTPEQLKHLQANFLSNNPLPPPGLPMMNLPLVNQKLLQHYVSTMRMPQMPYGWPPMPYGRQLPMPLPVKQIIKPPKEIEVQMNTPRAYQPPVKNSSPVIQIVEEEDRKKQYRSTRQTRKSQKSIEREIKKIVTPVAPPAPRAPAPKPKPKQVRHSSIPRFEPQPPKKRPKFEAPQLISEPMHRQTRQKKQNIEKIMLQVMKDKPLRDRVIKIGKDHQANLPESFINEYEYQLKLKMEKKAQLMARLIVPQGVTAI